MELTRLGGEPTDVRTWSPDGKRILFSSAPEGQFDIFYVSANGGAPKRLTKDPANDDYPSYSRDGNWIYFGSDRTGEFRVWKMPAEGGDAVTVTQTGGMSPCESPNSEFLYYTKGSALFGRLWKVPVKGGEETQVLEPLICRNFYTIIDKGVYFLYQQDTGFDLSVEFFDFSTKELKTVVKLDPSWFNYFDISPNGNRILYVQGDDLQSDLMLVENFR
jgi:dipeptidyl aminopeptidase/acylaminoacyl peptidase